MKEKLYEFIEDRKYELLLITLLIHLYIGIVLEDLTFYSNVIWPVNMVLIALSSIGIFIGKGRKKNRVRIVLTTIVIFTPITIYIWGISKMTLMIISLTYFIFFLFLLLEVLSFLLRPSYINLDIILASACGYFLLVEVGVFLLQFIYYLDPTSLKHINTANPVSIYMDLVYLSSITITTIGYGDITPSNHVTKLIVALFGVTSHLYSVMLIGILISKFSVRNTSS